MNKKGFTLIELLAVIVILAIIALITAPLVVGIITNSRESSNKVSATNYINAVNHAITKAAIDNISVQNGYYEITKEGSVCLDEVNNGRCSGKEIKITVNGNKPIKGNMIIDNEVVSRATVVFEDFSVEIGYDGEIEYKPFTLKYDIGQKVQVILGHETSGTNVDWYVIDEDAETVTLLFTDVVLESSWNNKTYHNSVITTGEECIVGRCTYAGPVSSYISLNNLFKDFDIPYINYEYKNNPSNQNRVSYQGFNIKNGDASITAHNGKNISAPIKMKARMISAEEMFEIASKFSSNYTYEKLRNFLSNNLNLANTTLGASASNVDELLEYLKIEDNTVNIYMVSLLATSNMDETELLTMEGIESFMLPGWLGINDKETWTNTTFDITISNNTASYAISATGINNGVEDLTIIQFANYYIYEEDAFIRPVIQMKKDDERVHQ